MMNIHEVKISRFRGESFVMQSHTANSQAQDDHGHGRDIQKYLSSAKVAPCTVAEIKQNLCQLVIFRARSKEMSNLYEYLLT